jgi:hypothetical protein
LSGDDLDPSAQEGAPSILRERLAEASRRIRLLRALSRAVRFALLAHLILVPWVLLRGLAPLPFALYALALLFVTFAGTAYGLLSPLPPSLVARLLDHRLALRERLGSALEVMHRQGQPMVDALFADAAAAAEGARLATAFPMAPPGEARYLLPVLALASALFLLPPLPLRIPGSLVFLRSPTSDEEQQPRAAEAARPDSRHWGFPKEPREREGKEASPGRPAPRQAWDDPAATYKDTAIGSRRPDFASFLRKGDERLRLLAPSPAFPDLQGDYTQSPSQAQILRMQEALREARLGKPSGAELERLMEALKGLNRRTESQGPPDGEKRSGDFSGQEASPSDRRLEALERALSRLRERGAGTDEGGQRLKPAPGPDSAGGEREGEKEGWPDGPREEGQQKGSRPGRSPSPQARDRPTPRIDSPKVDSSLAGQGREGKQESYDTDLWGAGAKSPSRLPYMETLTHYRQMAEEALSKERVPFNYREQVKEYFRSLEQQ